MAVVIERRYWQSIHPLHAVLVAGGLALFLGALLSDVTYYRSYHIQWQNFASWFIVGALFFTGFALVFALVDAVRRVVGWLYFLVLLATWLFGFFNALMHARDAWASMPGGLWLSVITFVFACVTTWLAFARPRAGGVA